MNYFKINGRKYNVTVTSLEESFTILYTENSGRSIADGAPMILDPIGTFFQHNVTVMCKNGFEKEYDDLYSLITQPIRVEETEDALFVEVAHLQESISYYAYISQGTRKIKRIDENKGKIYWGELSLNIVPIEAQIKAV